MLKWSVLMSLDVRLQVELVKESPNIVYSGKLSKLTYM